MDATQVVHVLEGFDHLRHEEATRVLAHGAHGLAQVEQEAALDVLHNDEDQVGDDTAAGLDHLAGVTEVHHADDAAVVEVLEDRNFVLNGEDGVFVAAQELLLEDLDGHLGIRAALLLGEVDFACVAFTEALQDLVLAVEDRVL